MTALVFDRTVITLDRPEELSSAALDAIERTMRKLGRAEPPQVAAAAPVRIGDYWPGQGGIYAGLARGQDGAPDYHLILALHAPEDGFTWDAAKAHAKTVAADGHRDFALPSCIEGALLYANLKDRLDPEGWHWLDAIHSPGRAFGQTFDYGDQIGYYVSFEARARFVRRLVL